MSEVAVNRKPSQSTGVDASGEPFSRSFPLARFFAGSPFIMMREFADELEHMLRRKGQEVELRAWVPVIDVQRSNGNLVVSADLPGLKKEDVKVEVTEESLIIEGERKREQEGDYEGYHTWERNYGRFYRVIPLPQGCKTDQAKAELRDGILKVSIPAPVPAKQSRHVPITG